MFELSPDEWTAVRLSLQIALTATAFSLPFGVLAAYALARVLRSPDFVWTAEDADDWRKPWPGFSGTRYEAKAKREGRVPAYFIFRKI